MSARKRALVDHATTCSHLVSVLKQLEVNGWAKVDVTYDASGILVEMLNAAVFTPAQRKFVQDNPERGLGAGACAQHGSRSRHLTCAAVCARRPPRRRTYSHTHARALPLVPEQVTDDTWNSGAQTMHAHAILGLHPELRKAVPLCFLIRKGGTHIEGEKTAPADRLLCDRIQRHGHRAAQDDVHRL